MKAPNLARARRLRRTSTDAEDRLWFFLRDHRLLGVKFRRQHPIGPYFADFCSVEHRLVIEVDGGQHSQRLEGRRTAFLEQKGFRVLRFWDNDVLTQSEAVRESIAMALLRDAR